MTGNQGVGGQDSTDAPSAASAVAASSRTGQPTVAQYAVQRLAALGIEHVFGVPGDYAFDSAAEAVNGSGQVS
ncbi:hypothetical protein [Kitasatospora sp. HPMI-4]|uniref:hypothetical protein n=1 Tax=Kitasatospora sp. HPMI-4 TaxID=3448443 RepID=UPI003F1AD9C4